MTKRLEGLIEVGHVGVDAGLMMVGDPCYVLGDDASHRQTSWAEICRRLGVDQYKRHEAGVYELFGDGTALICSSGYGDGEYPVYITLTSDGRPASITVIFDDPDDEGTEEDFPGDDVDDADYDDECGHNATQMAEADEEWDRTCADCGARLYLTDDDKT